MNEYLVTYLSKEFFLEKGWSIIAFNPPGSQGTFTIPNPLKDRTYKGQTGSLSPDLVAFKNSKGTQYLAILEAKPLFNQSDVNKMLTMFSDAARLEIFLKIVADQSKANGILFDENSKTTLLFYKAHGGAACELDTVGTILIKKLKTTWNEENFSPNDTILSNFDVRLLGYLP